MIIYTDDIDYANQLFSENMSWVEFPESNKEDSINSLKGCLYNKKTVFTTNRKNITGWQYLFVVKHALNSQFDILNKFLTSNKSLPGNILCLADSGNKFHGYRQRQWAAISGNLHLSAYLAPNQSIDHFHVGFTILSAVSVIQTIDSIPELKNKATIKWVNDILINGAKISGVIAQTQSMGDIVSGAVLGIGLNIKNIPNIESTSFVPQATCLFDNVKNKKECKINFVFNNLIQYLFKNYQILLNGGYNTLLQFYRDRSLVIGEKVIIYSDPIIKEQEVKIVEGTVLSIGENLELNLENIEEPIAKGRLVFHRSSM